MLEIAGVIISDIGLLSDLARRGQDLTSWTQRDLFVDDQWLGLALAEGMLHGTEDDYRWSREKNVSSREITGAAQVVTAINNMAREKYRVCRGSRSEPLILMKRAAGR